MSAIDETGVTGVAGKDTRGRAAGGVHPAPALPDQVLGQLRTAGLVPPRGPRPGQSWAGAPRPVLDLRPGDEVHDPSGLWLTVATRPRPNRSGNVLSWFYEGGILGRAHWLAELPSRPAQSGVGE